MLSQPRRQKNRKLFQQENTLTFDNEAHEKATTCSTNVSGILKRIFILKITNEMKRFLRELILSSTRVYKQI